MFESELVDATRETRVREPRFGDERGELAVGGALRGSFRHGAVRSPAFRAFEVPGAPVSSPYGLVNGVNVAESKHPIAQFAQHSSDRVRIARPADDARAVVQWRGHASCLTTLQGGTCRE
ncbi:hypothetical protein GCM10010330_79710 [Streptomyces tendae]|nr:hypothetical protein GCM10010330_79710 [Streptomyces tendae]